MTGNKWIAHIALLAITIGRVLRHRALSVLSASAGTWISAFAIHARQIRRAIRVGGTFGTTVRGNTDIIGQTRARWLVINTIAFTVWTARSWDTYVDGFIVDWWWRSNWICE